MKKTSRDLEADEKALDAKVPRRHGHCHVQHARNPNPPPLSIPRHLTRHATNPHDQIKRKQADLERHEKRLKSLQSVRSMTPCKLPSCASVRHLQPPAPRSVVCRSTYIL